jgi:hypothetical protein
LVYVDDMLLIGPSKDALTAFKARLRQHFPIKDLGDITSYLGMEVYRDRDARTLQLQQLQYIKAIHARFAAYNIRHYNTPLEVDHQLGLPSADDAPVPGQERYPELIGCLIYLMTCTRPDLAHSMSVLGSFVAPGRHGSQHWKAALRVLGYVLNTADLRLTLGGATAVLQGYTDASCQDDRLSRRSSHGFIFGLGSGAISWKATKSTSVALSSCEAELYGGTAAAQELLWLKRLLVELGLDQPCPVLWCDNQSTIMLTKDPIFSGRSKHIEARYYFIRELVHGRELAVRYIPSADNLADIFTKPLSAARHQELLPKLGLRRDHPLGGVLSVEGDALQQKGAPGAP